MTSERSISPVAMLALAGGLAGLVSLLLPWYELDAAALKQFAAELMRRAGLSPMALADPKLADAMSASATMAGEQLSGRLVGYRAFNPISVALSVLATAGAVWAAVRVIEGESERTVRRAFLGAAAVLLLRPVYGLMHGGPMSYDASKLEGVQLFKPGIGLYLSLAGGLLLLVAALSAGREVPAAPAAEEVLGASHLNPGGAHVPIPAQMQAAAPAYAPASPAYPAPGPSSAHSLAERPAYGADGPSALDADRHRPPAHDPYAPRPVAPDARPAPIVRPSVTAMLATPAAEAPSTAGLPAPAQPERSRSVAPPGFG